MYNWNNDGNLTHITSFLYKYLLLLEYIYSLKKQDDGKSNNMVTMTVLLSGLKGFLKTYLRQHWCRKPHRCLQTSQKLKKRSDHDHFQIATAVTKKPF